MVVGRNSPEMQMTILLIKMERILVKARDQMVHTQEAQVIMTDMTGIEEAQNYLNQDKEAMVVQMMQIIGKDQEIIILSTQDQTIHTIMVTPHLVQMHHGGVQLS